MKLLSPPLPLPVPPPTSSLPPVLRPHNRLSSIAFPLPRPFPPPPPPPCVASLVLLFQPYYSERSFCIQLLFRFGLVSARLSSRRLPRACLPVPSVVRVPA